VQGFLPIIIDVRFFESTGPEGLEYAFGFMGIQQHSRIVHSLK